MTERVVGAARFTPSPSVPEPSTRPLVRGALAGELHGVDGVVRTVEIADAYVVAEAVDVAFERVLWSEFGSNSPPHHGMSVTWKLRRCCRTRRF